MQIGARLPLREIALRFRLDHHGVSESEADRVVRPRKPADRQLARPVAIIGAREDEPAAPALCERNDYPRLEPRAALDVDPCVGGLECPEDRPRVPWETIVVPRRRLELESHTVVLAR